jgi:hypothetical protein
MKKTIVATAGSFALTACGAGGEDSPPPPTPFVPTSCADPKGKTVTGAFIDGAVVVPSNGGSTKRDPGTDASFALDTGAATRDAHTEFFLLPGVQHCGGGVGADAVGARVRKFAPNTVLFARPLCRHPSFPRYIGGDASLPASFSCSAS